MESFAGFLFQRSRKSLRKSALPIIASLAATCFLVLACLAISNLEGVPFHYLSKDPSAVLGGKLYAGFLSHLSVGMWFATGAICLFTASVLPGPWSFFRPRGFFLSIASLSFILGFDDLFMFHERILTKLVGDMEKPLILGYAAALGLILVVHWRRLLNSDFLVLFAASLAAFSMSLVIDFEIIRIGEEFDLHFVLEDGFKLLGLILWITFFVVISRNAILSHTGSA